MLVKQFAPNLYEIHLGGVNAFLIDSDELTLVDAGMMDSPDRILEAIQAIGKNRHDLRQILVTHGDPDHAGGLAELKKRTGAVVYMHRIDAAVTRTGKLTQTLQPTPGKEAIFRKLIGFDDAAYDAAEVEHEVKDGEELPIAGGIQAIHVPGHSAGQLAFLWSAHGGVLFVGDAASNMMGLDYSLGYQDFEQGKHDLIKLAALDFEIACFGHGEAIPSEASTEFRQKWGK